MNKGKKKKIDILNQRLRKLRQQLAGVKTQFDDPDEVEQLERQIHDALAELEKLKNA